MWMSHIASTGVSDGSGSGIPPHVMTPAAENCLVSSRCFSLTGLTHHHLQNRTFSFELQPTIMGRSAKIAKRPTRQQKTTSKVSKAASKPLPPPPPSPSPPADTEPKAQKKRKMMRAKAEKVSLALLGCRGPVISARPESIMLMPSRRDWAKPNPGNNLLNHAVPTQGIPNPLVDTQHGHTRCIMRPLLPYGPGRGPASSL